MKYSVTLLTLLLCLCTGYVYADPELQLVSKEWDFGKVKQGELKSKIFFIKNQGFEELIIDKIHTCCGYSVNEVSSWHLAPGEKASIEAVCNATRKMPGIDKKFITILSNNTKNPQLKIPTKAFIVEQVGYYPRSKKQDKISTGQLSNAASLSVDEVYERIERGLQVIMFDIREKSEYEHKYIPNSIRFARSKLGNGNQELNDLIRNINKRSIIIVYCASGTRSSYVTSKLRKLGYNAYNMQGGISAWADKGYPIIMGPKLLSSAEGIPIDLEEAYEYYYLLFNKNTQWIDVRGRAEYKRGHIKGAVNVPVSEIERGVGSIPRSQNLIIYCQEPGCGSASSAAGILIKNGFKKGLVRVFHGGFHEWKNAGYPTEK